MTTLLLDGADNGSGMCVLDIGCGFGAVPFMAIDRVGSNGQVIGLDWDADALQLARARQTELGLHNANLSKGGFDAV
nr:methyltransferase domain-containing protein [Ruegeria lacuscaerulensis]